jgi:hypothetical protein
VHRTLEHAAATRAALCGAVGRRAIARSREAACKRLGWARKMWLSENVDNVLGEASARGFTVAYFVYCKRGTTVQDTKCRRCASAAGEDFYQWKS